MNDFEYLEPGTIAQACTLLATHGEDARALGGGTALLLAMRQRMLSPTHLVSLQRVQGLRGVHVTPDGTLVIGAATRHAELAAAPVVRQGWPMLATMAANLANPQVRNQGTIGGNLCYADPSTDPPACLLALDTQVLLQGPHGQRVLPLSAFLVDYFTTALAEDELLVEIRVPPLPAGMRGSYVRHLRTPAAHRPLVTLAVLLQWQGSTCGAARIALGAAIPVAQRLSSAESLLAGRAPDAALVTRVADHIATHIDPLSDQRGSADYRRDIVHVLVQRTLAQLCGLTEE
jgi:aerobic carbon-monoxide dehydrogenase medium subunit